MPRSLLLVLVGLGFAALAWFAWPHGPKPHELDYGAAQEPGAPPPEARGDGELRLVPGRAGSPARRNVPPPPTAGARTEPSGASTTPVPGATANPETAAEPIGPFGRFDVVVRGPDGEAVASAHVNLIDAEGSRTSRVTNGRLIVPLRASNRPIDIEVHAARRADGTEPAWGWVRQRVPAAVAGGALEVRLPPELTIEGGVADASGLPVADAEIVGDTVRDDPLGRGGSRGDLASRTRTHPDGRFVLRRLGEGEIELRVNPPPGLQRQAPLRTRAGTQGLRIVLERAAAASVRVLDSSNKPVPGALVWVSVQDLDAGGVEPLQEVGYGSENLTDAQGAWAVPHLAPEMLYRLRVEPPRTRPDLVRQELEGWKAADTTVKLTSGNVVRGHVRDPQGRPVPEANLYWRQAGRWQSGNVGREGAFEIGGLEPGEVLLRATTAPDSMHDAIEGLPMFVEARVATGRMDVALAVERGAALTIQLEGWPGDRGFRKGHFYAVGLAGERSWEVTERIDSQGRILFHGLEERGTYTFWLPPEGGELSALQEDLRVHAGQVRVPVKAGLTIRGRMIRPEGADRGVVQAFLAGHPFHVEALPEPDGTFALRGIPEGTRWTVHGSCHVGETSLQAKAEDVAAGASVELIPQGP